MEIQIIEARGLIAADKGGTSDPFAVLTLLDADNLSVGFPQDAEGLDKKKKKTKPRPPAKKFQTAVQKKTLDPAWRETFTCAEPPDGATLLVSLFDDDLMGKDPLGCVALKVEEVVSRGCKVDAWYTLETSEGMDKVSGEVRVSLALSREGERVAEMRDRLFQESVDAWNSLDGNGVPNELRIAVVRAKNLPIMDRSAFGRGGSSDPMVVMTCDGQTFKSTVQKKTLHPVWREAFAFEVETGEAVLDIVVEDWDLASSNDFMGRVCIPMTDLVQHQTVQGWYPLLPVSGQLDDRKHEGEIEIAVRWMDNPGLHPPLLEGLQATPGEPPNELHVALRRARNLLAMDTKLFSKGEGTSDPVVTLRCGDATAKSTVKKKTLRPKWNETFVLDVNSTVAPLPELELVVEDWDIAGNDFIGRVDIDVAPLADQGLRTQWHRLAGKKGGKDGGKAQEGKERGEVEVSLRWIFNPAKDLRHFEGETDGVPDKPPNELRVAVIQATGLEIMDKKMFSKGGSSDPMARLRVGPTGKEVKTKVVKKSLRPLWNQVFCIPTTNPKLDLQVVVEDWDQYSGNDFMGAVSLPLSALASKEPVTKWFALRGKKQAKVDAAILGKDAPGREEDQGKGLVQLALHWWYNPDLEVQFFQEYDDDEYPTMAPNQLMVAVAQARGLIAMDTKMFSSGGGTSDPLTKVRCVAAGEPVPIFVNQKQQPWKKTQVVKKSLEPVWNEQLALEVEADALPSPQSPGAKECYVEVVVEDWDLTGNDFIGRVTIPLHSLVDKGIHRAWYELTDGRGLVDKSRGEVECVFRWVYNPTLYPRFFVDLSESQEDADKQPNELHVAIVRARRLLAMDSNWLSRSSTGTSDPLVILECDSDEQRTTTKKKTLTPVWNEVFTFPVNDTHQRLVLRVEDYDQGSSNDFMGRVVLPLERFKDKAPHQHWYPLADLEVNDPTPPLIGSGGGEPSGTPEAAIADRGDIEVAVRWLHNPELNPTFFLEDKEDARYLEKSPNELKIAVVRACNLSPGGGGAGSLLLGGKRGKSDPYVVVQVGDETIETSVQKRTLSPMWSEVFAVPASDMDAEVHVSVKDWDLGPARRHTLLGKAIIPMEPLADRHPDQSWHVLGGKNGAEDGESRGDIEIALHWWFNPDLEPEFFKDDEHEDNAPGGEFASREPNLLKVAVIQAAGLPAVNKTVFGGAAGTSDPMVTVRVKGSKTPLVQTAVKKKQLNPVWNHVQELPFADLRATLEFKVDDWGFTGHTGMGVVHLPLQTLYNKQTQRKWFKVHSLEDDEDDGAASGGKQGRKKSKKKKKKKKKTEDNDGAATGSEGGDSTGEEAIESADRPFKDWPLGSLEVAMKWVFDPEHHTDHFGEPEEFPERDVNELCVAVVQARSLPLVDRKVSMGECCDPMAVVRLGRHHLVRTQALAATMAPKWDKAFTLSLPEAMGLDVESLDVIVEDSDRATNELIGRVRIPLAPLGEHRELVRGWYELGDDNGEPDGRPRGEVEVALRWRYNIALDPKYQTSAAKFEWQGDALSADAKRRMILQRCKAQFQLTETTVSLTLRRIPVDEEQANLLAAYFGLEGIALAKADLRETSLGPESIIALCSGTAKNTSIGTLNVSRSRLADVKLDLGKKSVNPATSALSTLLASTHTLRDLDISECHLEPLGLSELSKGVRYCSSLAKLSLRGNPLCNVNAFAFGTFTDSGIEDLAHALKVNVSLTHVNLSDCQLSGFNAAGKGKCDRSALRLLTKALRMNKTIKQLDLSDNFILESGGMPYIQDVVDSGHYTRHDKLDRGNRVYLLLRRNMGSSSRRSMDLPFLELFKLPGMREGAEGGGAGATVLGGGEGGSDP